jgi:dipeptidyl aminopeptidase/acylaminoacyl peptidase
MTDYGKKYRNRFVRVAYLLMAVSLVLGVSCATVEPSITSEEQLLAEGYRRLNATEIEATLSGNTAHGRFKGNTFTVYLGADGQMRGVSTSSSGNTDTDRGRWEASTDDMFCDKWDKWRSVSDCDRVYLRGSKLVLVDPDGMKSSEFVLEQGKAPLNPQELNSLINSDGKIVHSERINYKSAFLDKTEYYKIRYLSDGLEVVGFIVKPKGNASKYPILIFNRGGNREYGKITKKSFRYLSYLSSKNFVVLASQYRGNDGGEGREEFGGKDVNDVLNLIKLAKSLPFVESSKIVMLGFSRGGMMTYLAIKDGAEIKAAAVVGGVTDLGQNFNERGEGMKRVIRELVGMDKKEWEKRSAYYWPEKIDVPVLILHGEDDWRVKMSQAKKLSERLKQAGKVHELVIFSGGDHGLNTHRAERNQRIFDWFDRYLNP